MKWIPLIFSLVCLIARPRCDNNTERYTTDTHIPVDVYTTCEHTTIKAVYAIREPFQHNMLVLTQKQIPQKVRIPCKFNVRGMLLRITCSAYLPGEYLGSSTSQTKNKHNVYCVHRGRSTRPTCFYIFVGYYNSMQVIVLFYYEIMN